MVATKLLVVGK